MRVLLPALLALALALPAAPRRAVAQQPEVPALLEPFIAHEMRDKRLLALSIALVDGRRIVWARGFGWANPADSTPATPNTLYRVAGAPLLALAHRAVSGARESATAADTATGFMWTYDGRTFPAPTFQPGAGPAGAGYASVTDLARLLSARLARATARHAPGFTLSRLDGRREIRLDGSTYGFATQLAALPDDGLGAVVAISEDGAVAPAARIAQAALRLMLAARRHRPLVAPDTTIPLPAEFARRLAGRYGSGDAAVDLVEMNGSLTLSRARGGVWSELRLLRDTLVVDDRLSYGTRVLLAGDAIVLDGDTLHRTAVPLPPPPPEGWRGLIGEYGPDWNTLYILERGGRLHALVDWFYDYPLVHGSGDAWRMPSQGRHGGEPVTFARNAAGRATAVRLGRATFPRRPTGPEDGSQFRIAPVRPVAELRTEAMAATPPRERGTFRPSDLVELVSLDTSIHLDIRYATSDNFMGTPMYREARAFLQRPAAEAVVRASRWLHARGFGLLIHDAYRPWFVTKMFWDATPPDKHVFVADPAQGSRHNRGCAVDLTLYDLATGKPVTMTGGYDEMTDRSYPDYPGGTSRQRWHRALLRRAMEMQGFTVYDAEWWHFDYEDWRHYAIGNVPFDAIAPRW